GEARSGASGDPGPRGADRWDDASRPRSPRRAPRARTRRNGRLIGDAGDALPALEASIRRAAEASAVALDGAAVRSLAVHARMVLSETPRLHLTAVDERDLVPRHIGEALEGARILEPNVRGLLVDLGSGNGYPGVPLAIARPGLHLILVEASARKAA